MLDEGMINDRQVFMNDTSERLGWKKFERNPLPLSLQRLSRFPNQINLSYEKKTKQKGRNPVVDFTTISVSWLPDGLPLQVCQGDILRGQRISSIRKALDGHP